MIDTIQMTDVILRHGLVVSRDDGEIVSAADTENLAKFASHDIEQFVVRFPHQLRLHRSTDKRAEQHAAIGCSTRELAAGK